MFQKPSGDVDDYLSSDSVVEPVTVVDLTEFNGSNKKPNKKYSSANKSNKDEISNANNGYPASFTPRDDVDRLASITLTKVTSCQEKICHLLDDIR